MCGNALLRALLALPSPDDDEEPAGEVILGLWFVVCACEGLEKRVYPIDKVKWEIDS